MNLERLLAENMKRFGTKNLSKTAVSTLQRLIVEGTTPAVEGQVAQRGKGTKEDPTYYIMAFTNSYITGIIGGSQQSNKMFVKGGCKSYDNKTWSPNYITFQYVEGNLEDGAITTKSMRMYYDNTTGTFKAPENAPTNWANCTYGGPGNKPVTAVNSILAAMKTKTGKSTLTVPADVSTGLQSMKNKYRRSSPTVTGTDILAGSVNASKWKKQVLSDPETDAAIGTPYLNCNNIYLFLPSADGSITKDSVITDFGGTKRGTVESLAAAIALKGDFGKGIINPSYYLESTNQDKYEIEPRLTRALGTVYQNATIAEPVTNEPKK